MTTITRLRSGNWSAAALSAGSIGNGALNAVILAMSARQGQTTQLAAYTVIVAVLALVSVAVGGGSALLYVSGTESERQAVRSQRIFLVIPMLAIGTLLAGLWYVPSGYEWAAILLTGFIVIGNNLAELQYGDLARQGKFHWSALIGPLSKLPALSLILLGAPLTVALSASVVVQFVINEILLRRTTSWFRNEVISGLSIRQALAALRLGRQLFAYSLVELYNGRAATIALSLIVSPSTMGIFGAVISTYQAFGAIFYSALQVPMAAKARRRLGISQTGKESERSELFAIIGVGIFSIALFLASPWIVKEGLNLQSSAPVEWLQILALALPLYLVNRAVAMILIGEGEYKAATFSVLPIAITMTLILVILLPQVGATGAALSILFAELAAVCFIISKRARVTFANFRSRR